LGITAKIIGGVTAALTVALAVLLVSPAPDALAVFVTEPAVRSAWLTL
jgi:hypothetical protein